MMPEKQIEPQNCSGMADILEQIDELDRKIIGLFGRRFEYVKSAANFIRIFSKMTVIIMSIE